MKRTAGLVVAGLLALGAGAGGTALLSSSPSQPVPRPVTAARTHLPALVAASGEPVLPSLTSLEPPAGEVVQAPGPFDDRFLMEGLQFDGRVVTGVVHVTSDVSELVDLQVLAGFYDTTGRLLGTASFEEHGDGDGHGHDGVPEQRHLVEVAVPPELAGKAVGAAVGVTVLVNE